MSDAPLQIWIIVLYPGKKEDHAYWTVENNHMADCAAAYGRPGDLASSRRKVKGLNKREENSLLKTKC